MGVKQSMNTFFSAMQGQNSSGYGGRLVNTPMGPFRWDDNFNMWINVNNGMALSNISFQDEFASVMDYDNLSGGPDNLNITLGWTPNDFTITTLAFSPNTVSLTSNTLAGSTVSSNIFTITGNTSATKFKAIAVTGSGTHFDLLGNALDITLTYRKNSQSFISYTLTNSLDTAGLMGGIGGIGYASGNTLAIVANSADWFLGSATYGIQLYNGLNGDTVCSNIWNVGIVVPVKQTTAIRGNLNFGDIPATGISFANTVLGVSSGFKAFASITSQTITYQCTSSNTITLSGNNVPINIKARVTNSVGVPVTVYGNTYISSDSNPNGNILTTTGLTVGPIKNVDGFTTSCGEFWLGLYPTINTIGTSGSGVIWLYNNTVGATVSTGMTYSYTVVADS